MHILPIFISLALSLHGVAATADNGVFSNAVWIGTNDDDQPLYSPYLTVFTLETDLQLPEGSTEGSIVYGANDLRLMDGNRSYVKVTLRLKGNTASLELWRKGYAPSDDESKPLAVFPVENGIINDANAHGQHHIRISSCYGDTDLYVDGQKVGNVNVNPVGRGGDYIAFPALADVGVAAAEGQQMSVDNFTIVNYRSPRNPICTVGTLDGTWTDTLLTVNPSRNAMPFLRTALPVDRPVEKATLHITARGIYDAYVNGTRVTTSYLSPGCMQYNIHQPYQSLDITSSLRDGRNIIGVQLAEGWWTGAATFSGQCWNYYGDRMSLLCVIEITYTDGTKSVISSSPDTWQYTLQSPVIMGSLYQGEVYDGRREQALASSMMAPSGDVSWKAAAEVPTVGHISHEGWNQVPAPDDYSNLTLIPAQEDGVDSVMTLKAIAVTEPRPGVWVYDMGQNMVGVPSIRMDGLWPGTCVTLRYAEVKYPDLPEYASQKGMIMMENIRAAMATDRYIARGGEEVFSPRYTLHGYRYVEITGIDKPLPLDAVEGVVLSSVGDIQAHYETSDSSVNRLWENIVWSTRGNFVSIPTDCPQRNERLGWAGDISVFSPTATYLTQASSLLSRYLMSMRDVQSSDGRFPDIAPLGGGFGGFLWGSAGIIVPWEMYQQWADTSVLRNSYDAMKRYVKYVEDNYIDKESGLMVQSHGWGDLADWLSPVYEQDDKSLIWEAYLIHDYDIMSEVAKVLGHDEDAMAFGQKASGRRAFFRKIYINPSDGELRKSAFVGEKAGSAVTTPTGYVLALAFNIVEGAARDSLASSLLRILERENSMDNGKTAPPYSLLTGFIGTSWISRALSETGNVAAAYRLLTQHSYPSWLYSVDQGATTIWERLNGYTLEDGFGGNNHMNSFNHYSFGAVGYWMIAHSLGIRRDTAHPGFSHFILSPEADPTGALTYARGWYDSIHGRIESSWRTEGGKVVYTFTVPDGTSATLKLPGRKARELGPGHYVFKVK